MHFIRQFIIRHIQLLFALMLAGVAALAISGCGLPCEQNLADFTTETVEHVQTAGGNVPSGDTLTTWRDLITDTYRRHGEQNTVTTLSGVLIQHGIPESEAVQAAQSIVDDAKVSLCL